MEFFSNLPWEMGFGFLLVSFLAFYTFQKIWKTTSPPPTHLPPTSLKKALEPTQKKIWGRIQEKLGGKSKISPQDIEIIEENLYNADLGPKTVRYLLQQITSHSPDLHDLEKIKKSLRNALFQVFLDLEKPKDLSQSGVLTPVRPQIWMLVGVNGTGKTTTSGKLALQHSQMGQKVLLVAADTFRAAAQDQLKILGHRATVEVFSPQGVKDPSAVAFDAIKKAQAQEVDLVLIDTAGRLHTQKNLMEELKKIQRVIGKVSPQGPHETFLILDANSGQNALAQAEMFHKALGLTGAILTKMDGSAKGGVAVGLAWEHQLPVRRVGVGEKLDDLQIFNTRDFIDSILPPDS